jgi:DNA-binding NarL/FixJ family response regulator
MIKVLVVDDQDEIRAIVLAFLSAENYQTLSASSGEVAVSLAKRERPDLVICDVVMPEFDGFDVLQALQADPVTANIPFIFLTAKDTMPDVRTAMNLGADDYLTKPISLPDLRIAIQARLRRQSQQIAQGARPDFSSPEPLHKLGLTKREAEVLLWVAQGKTSPEIGVILSMSTGTVKKHLEHIFEKLGIENRAAAVLMAVETLSKPVAR